MIDERPQNEAMPNLKLHRRTCNLVSLCCRMERHPPMDHLPEAEEMSGDEDSIVTEVTEDGWTEDLEHQTQLEYDARVQK